MDIIIETIYHSIVRQMFSEDSRSYIVTTLWNHYIPFTWTTLDMCVCEFMCIYHVMYDSNVVHVCVYSCVRVSLCGRIFVVDIQGVWCLQMSPWNVRKGSLKHTLQSFPATRRTPYEPTHTPPPHSNKRTQPPPKHTHNHKHNHKHKQITRTKYYNRWFAKMPEDVRTNTTNGDSPERWREVVAIIL